MGWFTDLVDRIDAKLDRPADQTVLSDPRKRRSMRMFDQMNEEPAERGSRPGEPAKIRDTAGEKNRRDRWLWP